MSHNAILHELTQRGLLELLETVCRRHHVTRAEVCSRLRTRMVSMARQELWWTLRNHAEVPFSYVELARIFKRNHSTILQGVRACEKLIQRRNALAARLDAEPVVDAEAEAEAA